ncbi:hypothetical protein M422DRAFT_185235, partial [Sphaerobolus stellatus SS14]
IIQYQCIYLNYRSFEDWREKRDILRCNPQFCGQPRYDCVAINTAPVSFGRLQSIFKCIDTRGRQCIVTLVTEFKPSPWKPRMVWEGCRIFEEKDYRFVMPKYLVRGCHMLPAFEKSKKVCFFNDLVDNDTFLRFFLNDDMYKQS